MQGERGPAGSHGDKGEQVGHYGHFHVTKFWSVNQNQERVSYTDEVQISPSVLLSVGLTLGYDLQNTNTKY